jgi:hypothetical protein
LLSWMLIYFCLLVQNWVINFQLVA